MKSLDDIMKQDTYYEVITLLSQLKKQDLDALIDSTLDVKQAVTLNKYVQKGFEMTCKSDKKT